MMAFLRSSSPESIVRISAAWTSLVEGRRGPARDRPTTSSPCLAQSTSTAEVVGLPAQRRPARGRPRGGDAAAGPSARWPGPSRNPAPRSGFRARSARGRGGLRQSPLREVGSARWRGRRTRGSVRRASCRRVLVHLRRVSARRRRAGSADGTSTQRATSSDSHADHDRRPVCRSYGRSSRRTSTVSAAGSNSSVRLSHAAVRIDGAADAGVGGADHVAALLDGPERAPARSAGRPPTTGRTRRRW